MFCTTESQTLLFKSLIITFICVSELLGLVTSCYQIPEYFFQFFLSTSQTTITIDIYY